MCRANGKSVTCPPQTVGGWLNVAQVQGRIVAAFCSVTGLRQAASVSLLLVSSMSLVGCGEQEEVSVAARPLRVRSERRMYDGAPPVIPHAPLGAACTACHAEHDRVVPGVGIAPANPHAQVEYSGATANCRQCHVFERTDDLFVENAFLGLRHPIRGDRFYEGAPPAIPHRTFMRETCLSCHSGPAARPEIRTTHPERANCKQCHMEQRVRDRQSDAPTELGRGRALESLFPIGRH